MGQWGAKHVTVCVFWNIIVIVSSKVHAVGLQCNSCIIMHGMEYVKKKIQVVTIYTTSLTFNNSTFCPHSVFVCFVWIWEQTAIISL